MSSNNRYPFVISFHILKVQLIDRAPGDEGWDRGFKQNWAAQGNRISCRLVQSVPTVDSPIRKNSLDNNNNSNDQPGAPSLREKSVRTATQILATTPPLVIDPKSLCAVIGGVGGSKPTTSSTSSSSNQKKENDENSETISLLVVPGIEEMISTSPVLLMEVCRHTAKQPNVIECRTTFNLVAMSASLGTNSNNNNSNQHNGFFSPTSSVGPGSFDSASHQANNNNSVSSFVVEHALMQPVNPLNDSTIFVVATVALTKQSLIAKIERRLIHGASNEPKQNRTEKNCNNGNDNKGDAIAEEEEESVSVVYVSPPMPTSVPRPPTGTLERLCGSVRLSTTDLVLPSLLFMFPDPSAHLVSNVLVVGNATESNQLLIKIQSSSPLVKAFPAAGTVIGPRQRAFFSVTFSGVFPAKETNEHINNNSNNSHVMTSSTGGGLFGGGGGFFFPSSSASSPSSPTPSNQQSGITLVKSSHVLQLLSHAKIEVLVQDVNSGEAHHSVPLRLHLRKSDQGQPYGCAPNSGVNTPYHFWINGVCMSNRSHDAIRELPYVESVLPVFLMRTPKEDIMAMAKDAIIKNDPNQPTLSNVDSFHFERSLNNNNNNGNSTNLDAPKNNNNNGMMKAGYYYSQDSNLHQIDLSSDKCDSFVISVNLGVLRGLLSTNSSTVGLHCPTYKIVACPLPERTKESMMSENDEDDEDEDTKEVEQFEIEEGSLEFLRFETGEVYPSTAGSLRWDMPLVFRRRRRKQPQPPITKNAGDNEVARNLKMQSLSNGEVEKVEANDATTTKNKKVIVIPWQHCRIGLRLVEIPPSTGNSSNQQQQSDGNNNNNSLNAPTAASSQGNVIAEATLAISPPCPFSSVPAVLSQPLVFVVRPCYPQYDALRTTSWLVKGTVIAFAGNV